MMCIIPCWKFIFSPNDLNAIDCDVQIFFFVHSDIFILNELTL